MSCLGAYWCGILGKLFPKSGYVKLRFGVVLGLDRPYLRPADLLPGRCIGYTLKTFPYMHRHIIPYTGVFIYANAYNNELIDNGSI